MICISWFIIFLRTLSYKSRSWRSLNSPLSSLLSGDSLLRDLNTMTLHRSNSFASPRALTGNTDAYKQYSAIQFGPTTFQSRWTVWKYCGIDITRSFDGSGFTFNERLQCLKKIVWLATLPTSAAKGQLILKCLFGVIRFFQKTNKNKSTWGIIVANLNFFIHFLEKLRIP